MPKLIGLFIICSLFFSCHNSPTTPDVSKLNINLTTQRFEQDLFALDTANFATQLNQVIAKYPSFGENFLSTILSINPKWSNDSVAAYVKSFITDYKNVFDTSQLIFKNFTPYENEIKNGLQFVKYYFPDYKIPQKIITYIGPIDGYGDIVTDDALIVGLHLHLGKNYSLYKSDLVQETYPNYLSHFFEPNTIATNCLKNIVSDIYPEKLEDKSLVQQMIEKGKRLYVLSKMLPNDEEYKLMGYTATQIKDCYEHEKIIWNLFVQNNLLQTLDENVIKNYIGEAPKTQELGDASPGNIGAFVGWQIVKKYMAKNNNKTLPQLMATDNDALFAEAKYKP